MVRELSPVAGRATQRRSRARQRMLAALARSSVRAAACAAPSTPLACRRNLGCGRQSLWRVMLNRVASGKRMKPWTAGAPPSRCHQLSRQLRRRRRDRSAGSSRPSRRRETTAAARHRGCLLGCLAKAERLRRSTGCRWRPKILTFWLGRRLGSPRGRQALDLGPSDRGVGGGSGRGGYWCRAPGARLAPGR
jgi:hypothetical protein